MNKINFELKEFLIVLAAKNNNPTVLNPDFLKYNKIVPNEWILASPPICIEPMARVEFQNRIAITCEPEKIIFAQYILNKESIEKTPLPSISSKYINTLSHVNYTAVGINLNGHMLFENDDEAIKFIHNKFLKRGTWDEYANGSFKAGIDFSYNFEQKIFNVSLKNALYKVGNEKHIQVVVASSNSHHDIANSDEAKRIDGAIKVINDWKEDLNAYLNFIDGVTKNESYLH